MATSMRRIDRKEETDLLHGDEGGNLFKYDLPVLNEPIKFNTGLMTVDEDKEV